NKLKGPGDLSGASVADLVAQLGSTNLSVRMTAMNQLVERGGKEGIEAVRKQMNSDSLPTQRMHGLWVLERQKALDDKVLTAAAQDEERGVRVHAMRVLAERSNLTKKQRELVLAGLKDKDAFVQRAAAQALGSHPDADNIAPLLELRHKVPAKDTHLLHV